MLIWWDKTCHSALSTSTIPTSKKPQLAFKQSARPSKSIESVSADGDLVCSPTVAPVFNDPADDLLKRVQQLLATGDYADRDLAYTNLLPALVKMKPDVAAQFAESVKSDLLRAETLRVVAQTWASLNPAEAENWSAQLPDSKERNLELSFVCNEVASTDAARAVRTVEQLGLGEHTEAMLQNFAERWAAQDFASAKAWVMAQPASEHRDNLLARIAFTQSATVPAEAAKLVAEQIPPGSIQNEAVISVVHQWGTRDMAGAVSWVEFFPSGLLKEHAEQELSGIAADQNAPPEKVK
jgi:hypothetical protein